MSLGDLQQVFQKVEQFSEKCYWKKSLQIDRKYITGYLWIYKDETFHRFSSNKGSSKGFLQIETLPIAFYRQKGNKDLIYERNFLLRNKTSLVASRINLRTRIPLDRGLFMPTSVLMVWISQGLNHSDLAGI